MIYVTIDFTAADGTFWTDLGFALVEGSAVNPPTVVGNEGRAGATGADRFLQADAFPGTRDYKVRARFEFQSTATEGRQQGLAVRLTDDGEVCYYAMLAGYDPDTVTLDMPHVRLYRRRGGVDIALTSWTDISANVSGADLDAGVRFQLRVENTDENTVNLQVRIDDGAGFVTRLEYNDTNALRIEDGGSAGVVFHSNTVGPDIVTDDFVMEDFEDEAPSVAYETGIGLIWNGTYYNEDELRGLGVVALEAIQSYTPNSPAARLQDNHDFHDPLFKAGDDITILRNNEVYATGVVRPVIQEGESPEGNAYEVYSPKQLARGVLIQDDETGGSTVYFNQEANTKFYRLDLSAMAPGHMLAYLFDNHLEGEDGLRAHKAAPSSGNAYVIPAALDAGPKRPNFSVTGDFAQCVEQILEIMPSYAWYVDPETKVHTFHDRDAGATEDVEIVDGWVTARFETHPEYNKTAVVIVGSEPEIENLEFSLSGGTLQPSTTGFESTWTAAAQNKNLDIGTVTAHGTEGSGNKYVDVDFTMVANEWQGTLVDIEETDGNRHTYRVVSNTASRIEVDATAWEGGGPLVGNDVLIRGDEDEGVNNAYYDTYRTYEIADPADQDIKRGACATVKFDYPLPGGGYGSKRMGAKIGSGGKVTLDKPALLPLGLVNYPGGGSGYGCAAGEGGHAPDGVIGDITVETPVKRPNVPRLRVPTEGFRGTAYTADSSKHDGGGEPGVGDPGVRDILQIEDPAYRAPAVQNTDYIAWANALLKVYGHLAVQAELTFEGTHEERWLGLGKRINVLETGGRTTGYESANLWVMEVRWNLGENTTTVLCGTHASFGGVNLQAVRQIYAENARQRAWQEKFAQAEELINCLRDQAGFRGGAVGSDYDAPICASQVAISESVRGGGSTNITNIEEEITIINIAITRIQGQIDGILDVLSTQKSDDSDGGFWITTDGELAFGTGLETDPTYNPETGEWVDSDGNPVPAPWIDTGLLPYDVPIGGMEGAMAETLAGLAANLGKTINPDGSVVGPGGLAQPGAITFGWAPGGTVVTTPATAGAPAPGTVGGLAANNLKTLGRGPILIPGGVIV